MALRSIPRNLISIVTLQSLLLCGFQRLVFRPPAVLEKPLGRGAFLFITSTSDSQWVTSTDVSRTGREMSGNAVRDDG